MRHQFGWDLPPGVSVKDIEDAQGEESEEVEAIRRRCAENYKHEPGEQYTPMLRDLRFLLSQIDCRPQKCIKCDHSANTDPRGRCMELYYDAGGSLCYCGCKCEFSEIVTDTLVDEVQRRMDQVVEAAVEWHQAGSEGEEWFGKAEILGAAIDSLLELRDKPNKSPKELGL